MSSSGRIVQPPGQVHHNRVQWPPGSAVSNLEEYLQPCEILIVSLFYYFLFSPKVNQILISVPARMFFNIQSCIATFDRAPKPFFDLLSSIFPFSTNNTYLLVQSPAFCPLKDLDKPWLNSKHSNHELLVHLDSTTCNGVALLLVASYSSGHGIHVGLALPHGLQIHESARSHISRSIPTILLKFRQSQHRRRFSCPLCSTKDQWQIPMDPKYPKSE